VSKSKLKYFLWDITFRWMAIFRR